jgi:hypothetical protein
LLRPRPMAWCNSLGAAIPLRLAGAEWQRGQFGFVH